MAVRCLVNMMQHSTGQNDIKKNLINVIDGIIGSIFDGNSNMQIACSTFYMNLSQILNDTNTDLEKQIFKTIEGIMSIFTWINDNVAKLRGYKCLKYLLSSNYKDGVKIFIKSSEQLMNCIQISTCSDDYDLREIANFVKSAIQ